MLPIDVQAELIKSFQDEKRQRYAEMKGQQRAVTPTPVSWRARLLRASGSALIAAGRGMQRAAGLPLAAEYDARAWASRGKAA
jgi:hypothetical protein